MLYLGYTTTKAGSRLPAEAAERRETNEGKRGARVTMEREIDSGLAPKAVVSVRAGTTDLMYKLTLVLKNRRAKLRTFIRNALFSTSIYF